VCSEAICTYTLVWYSTVSSVYGQTCAFILPTLYQDLGILQQ
jgi:hypothetical protein